MHRGTLWEFAKTIMPSDDTVEKIRKLGQHWHQLVVQGPGGEGQAIQEAALLNLSRIQMLAAASPDTWKAYDESVARMRREGGVINEELVRNTERAKNRLEQHYRNFNTFLFDEFGPRYEQALEVINTALDKYMPDFEKRLHKMREDYEAVFSGKLPPNAMHDPTQAATDVGVPVAAAGGLGLFAWLATRLRNWVAKPITNALAEVAKQAAPAATGEAAAAAAGTAAQAGTQAATQAARGGLLARVLGMLSGVGPAAIINMLIPNTSIASDEQERAIIKQGIHGTATAPADKPPARAKRKACGNATSAPTARSCAGFIVGPAAARRCKNNHFWKPRLARRLLTLPTWAGTQATSYTLRPTGR